MIEVLRVATNELSKFAASKWALLFHIQRTTTAQSPVTAPAHSSEAHTHTQFSLHASSAVDKLDPVGEPSDAVSSVEEEAKVAARVTLAPPVRAGPSLVGCCARVSCA